MCCSISPATPQVIDWVCWRKSRPRCRPTLFGYPNTTGLSAVDYRITDAVADPVGTESLYVERLYRLPRTAWVYGPPDISPKPGRLPSLEGKPFTFGCLNNPGKISEAAVQAWSEILQACPESRLLLLVRNDPAHEGLLLEKFGRHDVDESQLIFAAKGPESVYLELHNQIDLMLDPFPYNGGVTTGDCLWMGTPILTLAGDSYVSRQGVGLLAGVGLEEFVAANREDLVAKAVGWAAAPGDSRNGLPGCRNGFRLRRKWTTPDTPVNWSRRCGRWSRLDRDERPFEIVSLGIFGEYTFVLDQYRPDDGRVVRPPDVVDVVGNQPQFVVSVDEGVGRLGDGNVGQIVVGSLDEILHDIREKLELLHEMRELRRVDLGELQLECREFFVDSMQNFRCDLFRAVMEEFCYF